VTLPDPYPGIEKWTVPAAALYATLRGVRPAGLRATESGAFWLGRRASRSQVTSVIVPRGAGVIERANMWQLSPEVFGTISRWALTHEVVMLGMFHIHIGTSARMSRWDRERVVQVPGVLSVIAANAGVEQNHRTWAWYVYEGSGYREMDPVERDLRIEISAHLPCSAWTADAGSIRVVNP